MSDIAVDTSALVEVMIEGPEAQAMRDGLNASAVAFVSSVTRVEAAFVMMGRFGWTRSEFDQAWESIGVEELSVDSAIAALAIDAFEAWGKGRGTAGLNFGDCFSYALARGRSLPLLFVGEDFSRTDVGRV
jgi:ribonuclease VapC